MRRFSYPAVIWLASAIALWRSALALVSPDGLRTTPMYAFQNFQEHHIAVGIAGIIVSIMALEGLRPHSDGVRAVLLWPQLCFLAASAIGPVVCMIGRHYADGVLRGFPFIATDQIAGPALLLVYIYALMMDARSNGWK